MKAVQLTKEEAVDFWDMASPHLQRVLDKTDEDEYSVEDILERVKEETLALFLMIDSSGIVKGAYTISVHELPNMRTATIVHLGADNLEDAIACYPKMEEYAIANGAKKINVLGRRGWKPTLQDLGFNPQLVRYEKRL